jgi:hypothetical protein
MFRETEETVPSVKQYHVIAEVFALYFELLHDYDVAGEYVKHGRECASSGIPWWI